MCALKSYFQVLLPASCILIPVSLLFFLKKMLNDLNKFFLNQDEPNKSCFMALRKIILGFPRSNSSDNPHITEHWRYKVPFYYLKGKPFCYLWQDKKTKQPYIGIVKGHHINSPFLIKGNRKKMKVFRIDPKVNLPVDEIYLVFEEAVKFYS